MKTEPEDVSEPSPKAQEHYDLPKFYHGNIYFTGTEIKVCKLVDEGLCKNIYLGIEFYLRITKFTRGPSVASYLHEKQTSRIQSLYLYFIKIVPFSWFWLRNIRFLVQNTRSLFYGRHYSSLHRLLSLHRKLNVKIFLMFIVAENTRSVNIIIYLGVACHYH